MIGRIRFFTIRAGLIMDLLEDIFASMRVESALYARLQARVPWGIAFDHQVSARFGIVAHGGCLLDGAGLAAPLALAAGDLFIVSGGQQFRLMDQPGRETPPCGTVFDGRVDGVIRFGGAGAETGIVSGRFLFDAAAGAPLMALLPPVLHLRLDAERARLLQAALEMIARENAAPALGSRLVVQKLVDVLLIEALRIHCLSGQGQGWLGALADRRLSPVLRALHEDLSAPWTLDAMAARAGMSRSAFARYFRARVGDTPLNHLTGWRMQRARALLGGSRLSLAEVAARVGYDSDAAFQRAFKRLAGVPPGEYRRAAQA
ncbi:AraC family transcriptional regulator [Chromobacterium alticapitis]|uniref:AraC family transcriptional regulator n=1 Tax=Chromobacterium alticapitis TaxID=2073169 RepID=A0A2S5DIQ5_9NEIS|nr:AraC family transcriptional regulator [Chromobacterium alticapitis]POZ62960.1 AraC family transcriptional regulator [Chromobacterium alticapitis]